MNYAKEYAVGDIVRDDHLGLDWVVDEVHDDCMYLHQNQPGGVVLHVSETTCKMKFTKSAKNHIGENMKVFTYHVVTPNAQMIGLAFSKDLNTAKDIVTNLYWNESIDSLTVEPVDNVASATVNWPDTAHELYRIN